ncbi:hypothetical protein BVRB_033300 [Beta vulgaris subsp. vulgaris]|uniref:HAUS augmin-like complex subunit 3 N-terminal domain-containing protein n=1 Tax=Beta vulgaris subsp. vulgaris TaxID=3555 RepID=A0A0J8B016_BETVV|nr:hypothetical protein BVRB_033300 [Beta vulgaris subsp. vulgaris]
MADRLAGVYTLLQQADGVQRPDTDLSWMWSEPGAEPLLEWIVNNVNPKCLLMRDELSEYQRLDSSGRIVDSTISKQHERLFKGADCGAIRFNSERIANDAAILSRQQRMSMGLFWWFLGSMCDLIFVLQKFSLVGV